MDSVNGEKHDCELTNNSKKVREEITALSAYIAALHEQFPEIPAAGEWRTFLFSMKNELDRLCRAFDTRRFFVVTIGALKAGKSTLINALTGSEVSPAGTGAETTKKCSIIMSADAEHPEGITLYRYKNSSAEEDRPLAKYE